MHTRSGIAGSLVVGMVAAALSVTLTTPYRSSSGVLAAAAAAPTTARAKAGGSVTLSAPVIQPGPDPDASWKARLQGSIRFKPRHRKRPVVIQRAVGPRWKRVATKRQDKRGVVTFTGTATDRRGRAYRYRGVAKRWRGKRPVVSEVRSAGAWAEAFTEEFDGDTLGPQWADRPVNSPSRQCSKVGDPRASSVGEGTLTLEVLPDPDRLEPCVILTGEDAGTYDYYLNGQVGTQHLAEEVGAFTYGTFAARMKFQQNRGQHGSFWMQPLELGADRGTPAASGAEIDAAEFFGQGYPRGGLASFVYNYGVLDESGEPVKIGGMAPKATRSLPKADTWWTSYHVFSVEWTPTHYTFMVDGRPHFTTTKGVSGVPEYMILSLLSSDWELKQAQDLGIEPGGATDVDWVRVWQH